MFVSVTMVQLKDVRKEIEADVDNSLDSCVHLSHHKLLHHHKFQECVRLHIITVQLVDLDDELGLFVVVLEAITVEENFVNLVVLVFSELLNFSFVEISMQLF